MSILKAYEMGKHDGVDRTEGMFIASCSKALLTHGNHSAYSFLTEVKRLFLAEVKAFKENIDKPLTEEERQEIFKR